MINVITALLAELEEEKPHMPPTLLFNEGWLMRVVLHWFSQNNIADHSLSFRLGAVWYSEGLLSSPFLPVYRGDKLAESFTHADGIIGNIDTGRKGKADIQLVDPYEGFVVIEAKLFSKLADGTTRVSGYNQAARNIACIANVIAESNAPIDLFKKLGFYVLAPEKQINDEPTYNSFMERETIYQTVLARVKSYRERTDYVDKRRWFKHHFEPLLSKIDLKVISWEKIINSICDQDSEYGNKLWKFHELCLKFNTAKQGVGSK